MSDLDYERSLMGEINLYIAEEKLDLVEETEKQTAIRFLINGEPLELGGLTALRGFVYQYYVAAYYMVEMLDSDAWWEEVLFEYIDDVTLLGKGKIRFVQVKTVREDWEDRHFTPNTFYKREKGTDSWLDTLFLTYPKTQELFEEQNYTQFNDLAIEFELATNSTCGAKDFKKYVLNKAYNISTKTSLKDDKLLKGINKKIEIKQEQDDGKTKTEEYDFFELTQLDADWCLRRFHINYLGALESLQQKIIGKLADRSYMNSLLESELNKKSLPKGREIYNYISQKILGYIILNIVNRTHSDESSKKEKLIFSKKELEQLFRDWQNKALYEIQNELNVATKRSFFYKCFEEIYDEINSSWDSKFHGILIDTLSWVQQSLEKEVQKGNQYAYEQFYNRLFYLNNFNIVPSYRLEDSSYLKTSLTYMMICLVFYPDRDFLFENAQLLFKRGKQGDEAWNIFAIYNAREEATYLHALRKIIVRAEECSLAKSLQQNYYFFIVSDDKNKYLDDNPFVSEMNITQDYEDKEIEIMRKHNNIMFQNSDKIENVKNWIKKGEINGKLNEENVRKVWHQILAK